ncbi:MAG TPA: DNA methyltransferase [Candidatus Hydrogenedentes bacterium]|nr:DNA methyltransferase [Candidatus Hydrogenedentota bacterium]HPG69489.1 DNA methyltransferase [Candidatus Hydrogenedentota bacterium]
MSPGNPRTPRGTSDWRNHGQFKKPELEVQTTTLWDYPSQHYGHGSQGDQAYVGATPSYIIWNLLQRYTREGDLVVDPMCGSGTTLDVARDLGRKGIGYDIAPYRDDILLADARQLPLDDASVDFVFVDPPYSTHVDYSDDPRCIGKLDALGEEYYQAMASVIGEIERILKPQRYMALYCCDSFRVRKPFCPIGFRLFSMLESHFQTVDIIAVTRRNRTLMRRHYHSEAVKGNYFLRGFNYLFIMRRIAPVNPQRAAHPKRPGRRRAR